MKNIFNSSWCLGVLVVLSFVVGTANATPVDRPMAEAYFQNCKSQPAQGGLSAKSQKYLCACTAAAMMNTMQVEDVQAMSQPNAAGRAATNKMLINVYAPCMRFPAKDHYYNNCITNPQTKTLSRNPQKLCGCMSDEVANYLENRGPEVFKQILQRNPNIVDPMTALTNDKAFQSYAQSRLIGCVTK